MHRFFLVFTLVAAACGDNIDGNTPPTITDVNVTTDEDTPITRPLDIEDAQGDVPVITLGTPAHGTVTLSGSSFTYTPEANYNGTDTFTVTVSDDEGQSSAAVDITITPVNDAPMAVADAFATNEDTAHETDLSSLAANDIDVDGDTLTVTAVSSPTNGTVILSAGDAVFTPASNFSGAATYRYTVSDGTETAEGTVTITVGGVNDAPIANDDVGTTDEDVDLVVTGASLAANDTDPDGQTLTVTAVDNATNGSVTLTAGSVTFVPTANFNGTATFDYTVSDGADTDTGTVTVTVTAVNDAPVAVGDTASTAEETPVLVTAASMLSNDTDVDGTPTFVSAANAMGGTISVAGNGDVTYTPDLNFVGAGSFDYTITDGTAMATGTVVVTVTNVNDAPDAITDVVMTNQDVPAVIAFNTLLANDVDSDNDPLDITAVTNAVNGTVTIDTTSNTVTFTPDTGFGGNASFDYTISDGNGGTDTVTVTVIVLAGNVPPDAVADSGTTDEDTPIDFTSATLLANDTDANNDTLTVTSVSNATNGSVTLAAGTATFTPDADFSGTASFDYTIDDGNGGTDTATVTITVNPINDLPVAVGDAVTVLTDTASDFPVAQFLANDTDIDGPAALTITAVANVSNGTVSLAAGVITYQSAAGFTGTATFDYTVSDSVGSATGTVTVTVVDGLTCGDGFVAGTEECDDDNTDETDGCTSQCLDAVVCNATEFAGGDRFAVKPDTGTCYVSFDADLTTFADAQTACLAAGGHLATITSGAEQTLINTSVQNPAENPWIGASEDGNDTDAVFDWVTDEAFSFTAFAAGQPDDDAGDGGNGDCLHLFNAAGEWNDTNCNINTFVVGRICEFAVETCGDGLVQSAQAETCDDGNTTDGDGCSATCTLEALVTFSFTGAAGNEVSFAPDTITTGVTVSNMSRGTGVTASAGSGAFAGVNWSTAGLDANDYFAFSIAPGTNTSMSLTILELDERRSGTGPRIWSVRSSLDGFATDIQVFNVPDNDLTRTNQQLLLGAAFQNLTAAVEFRIYGYMAEGTAGTWRLDNVQVYGTAQ